ncbi:MAG: class E sortase [Microbacteriaceae bacterium]|nr:class E sortase [Microbacteriaceae bacterium]
MNQKLSHAVRRAIMSRRIREVISDVFITIGVLVLFFYVWYVWLGDLVVGAQQDLAATTLSNTWEQTSIQIPEFDRESGNSEGAQRSPKPPVLDASDKGEAFATIMIPRFGKNYIRSIAESVDVKKVLNDPSTGIGHYSSTTPLGAVGNFALAGHRTTFGAPFGKTDQLRVGDRIYVETKKGWYVYRFRNIEFVYPTQADVLSDVPRETIVAEDRILTMTTCHPKHSAAERLIAYSVFESFVPRRNGAPTEVTTMRTES